MQALCEDLTKKASDLAWENENLKRVGFRNTFKILNFSVCHDLYLPSSCDLWTIKEKELALKEYQSLEITNKELKEQVGLGCIYEMCIVMVFPNLPRIHLLARLFRLLKQSPKWRKSQETIDHLMFRLLLYLPTTLFSCLVALHMHRISGRRWFNLQVPIMTYTLLQSSRRVFVRLLIILFMYPTLPMYKKTLRMSLA